ncbi:hypothetical protein GCM10018781_41250 [Kitasatospora indigofera]|uniref:Chaplin domain-containing protein n=1 Tax=Kitasatospora indigofera TaxID=67307 RepID=A0A919FYX8_9ACTN|nr:chaplin [Kitasatospora indigofera]GHH74504.1 hypothetical protein GCM10018781_41250 [Kitasatospora indigofera]
MRNVAKKGLLTAVATGSVLASTAGYAYASAEAHGGAVNSPGVGSGNTVQVPVDVPVNACGNTVDVIGLLNPAYGNRCANADAGTHGHAAKAHNAPEPGRSATSGAPGQSAPAHSAPAQPAPAHSEPAHQSGQRPGGHDASGISGGGASASGTTAGSPGVLSGNSAAVPVSIPVNACGNSANVVGAANPAFGNSCGNVSVPTPPATTEEECPPEEAGSTPPPETPGTPRAGGPAEAPPVTQAVAPAAAVVPAQATAPQLASTGAGGVEMLGAAGLAALLGGGVLYRRARAGVR